MNKFWIFGLFVLLCVGVVSAALSDGLVAYYTLDDVGGVYDYK